MEVTLLKIVKRNGSKEPFNVTKVELAITKAFEAVDVDFTDQIISTLALKSISKVKKSEIPIEILQDAIEETLLETGYTSVGRQYTVYREKRNLVRSIDYQKLVEDYIDDIDWRVKENSTVTYSIGGLILHNSGGITANYWLNNIYSKEIAEAHKAGDMHIHDLSMLTGYCAGWSLKKLLQVGLGGVAGKVTSAPAKHLSTAVNHMVNFLGILQNEWAGAQAFSSFDTYLAPFAHGLDYKQIKQCIQSFVFGVNVPSRWGTQAPFSNITLDWTVPEDLKDQNVIIGGEEQDTCYGDYQKEMDLINKAFLEVMIEGDAAGRGFQYPIPTYNVTEDFDWESENSRLLFTMTGRYGVPYFQNFINSDMEPGDVRSMCCRLQLDKRELWKKTGGLFGSGEETGSVGVVTINLPRVGKKVCFWDELGKVMNKAKESLEIKREVVSKLLDSGFYPYTKYYLGSYDSHFSTIGLVGMNEMCINRLGKPISDPESKKFSENVLDFMREKLSVYQEETGNLYNLEASPAESATYRLAKADDSYKDFYTNSCHLPVDSTTDLWEALTHQDDLQVKFTGGTVFHTFIGESISDWQQTRNLVKKIAYNFRMPYYTISPVYSVCSSCGYIRGKHFQCPECGKETEVYSRITGYYRPVKNWNKGKKEEFKYRREYVISNGE